MHYVRKYDIILNLHFFKNVTRINLKEMIILHVEKTMAGA